MSQLHLLIIDPQNDFCDLPATLLPPGCAPQLPVTGAHADMCRLADFVRRHLAQIDDITVTLDSHHRIGIERPGFWLKADGGLAAPFTAISAAQVRAGEFAPCRADDLARVLAYLDALEAAGRYQLMIWPVHCETGTWGHNVHAELRAAYNAWETRHSKPVTKVLKGSNPWTEHYSALMAEVPDPHDAATLLNHALLERLASADRLLVAGEASSHCVKATVEHLVAHLPPDFAPRITLLTDCMSPVPNFETQQAAFFADMAHRGVLLGTAAGFFA